MIKWSSWLAFLFSLFLVSIHGLAFSATLDYLPPKYRISLKKPGKHGIAPVRMQIIRAEIQKNRPRHALNLLKGYPHKTDYLYLLSTADGLFLLSQPRSAMSYYQAAYKKAANSEEKKGALFGIAKTALWLENYEIALHAYVRLSLMDSNPEDQEMIRVGRITAASNMDYPRKAYQLVRPNIDFHSPRGVIAAAKAALSAGWIDKAKKIRQAHAQIWREIPADSYLAKQRKDVDWQILKNSSQRALDADFYMMQDSDQFKITRESVYASDRLFGINSNTTVLYNQNNYFDPTNLANAELVFIKQEFFNIAEKLNLDLTAAVTRVSYKVIDQTAWNPFLWQTGLNYFLNDYASFNLYNQNGLVETIPALQNKVLINTTEASMLLHPWSRVYARLTGFYNEFTDDNIRKGGAASLTYQLVRALGLFTDVRYRAYQNSYYEDLNYFSPYKLQDLSLFLIVKRRLPSGFLFYADGGIGSQTIQTAPSVAAATRKVLSYNFAAQKKIGRFTQLSLNYGYTQNAFNNFLGAYAQNYWGVNLKFFID